MAEQTKTGWLRLLSLDILIAAVLCFIAIILFAFVAHTIVLNKQDLFDTRFFQFFQQYTTPLHTRIALFITFFGSGTFLLPFYLLVIIVLWFARKRNYAVITGAIAIVSFILGAVLKNLFQRERPLLEHLDAAAGGYSFPSGHTLAIFTFAGMMMYHAWHTRWKTTARVGVCLFLWAFACLVGLSRIYLHVHFASDVLGGLCVTIIWLGICFIYFHWGTKRWLV
ncbi:undecaprenyl-diphosphatase [Filimonas lacunae]|uniref:Undecaprenyl-diphosphatase n=1 Tax=Filimonas lacunae TaxID=477680 RepID=A0A173MI30_9BACT|nr:phosphatase PAP2 family protein [Filimonas lacunae]BAV07274.1 phosphatase [Filimonas lacunae]SIS92188.1 undecaprenyl-diphosphatase [Filimonas lacunae]